MEPWIEWGYGAIHSLQAYRTPVADLLFTSLSFLGEEEFYLVLVPLLYWLVDKRLATRFAILFLLSAYLNTLAKSLLAQPRPAPTRVTVLDDPTGGGLPSGHAQNAVVSWGLLAQRRRVPWFTWAMGALIVAIGLSRVYLGVHFPHDVLAGWLLGALLLALFLALAPRVERWLVAQPLAVRVAAPFALAALLALCFHEESALNAMATLAGLALGVPLERAGVRFHERASVGRALGRLLVGLAVALLIWRGLKPPLATLGAWGAFLRYSLLGLWLSAGAPWLFVRSGLAAREVQP